MYKQLMDKEWLEKMAKSKTDQEIADIVGCTVHGVISARLRFGIKRAERDWRRYSQLRNEEWLREKVKSYNDGEIAEILGCTSVAVCNARTRFGIQPHRLWKPRRRDAYEIGGVLYRGDGYVIGSLEAIEHFEKRKKCFTRLANAMLDGTWKGEWCYTEKDLRRAQVKRDLRKLGFGWGRC